MSHDEESTPFSSADIRSLLEAVLHAKTSKKSSKTSKLEDCDLPPALALVKAAFLTSPAELGSPSFLVHFLSSTIDPKVALSATELALALLNVFRSLLVHPTLLEAVKKDTEMPSKKGETTVSTVYEDLCTASARFARDLFQHTLRAVGNHKHSLVEANGNETDSEKGPFQKCFKLPTSRSPLREVSINDSNISSSRQNQKSSPSSASKLGAGGSGVHQAMNHSALKLVWEPVLIAQSKLLQECTQFAAITMHTSIAPGASPPSLNSLAIISNSVPLPSAYEIHRRFVVAEWVHSCGEITTRASKESLTSTTTVGHRVKSMKDTELALANVCDSLAQSVSSVSSRDVYHLESHDKISEVIIACYGNTLQFLH